MEWDVHFDGIFLDRRIEYWLKTSGGIMIVGTTISQTAEFLEGEVEVTETVIVEKGPA